MTIGVPAATVISSGAACRYGAEGKRFNDTLSLKISGRNAARTIRGGDFSTLWRLCIESPQSGEISPSDGTGGITVGDLSTQSIMGAVPVCLP